MRAGKNGNTGGRNSGRVRKKDGFSVKSLIVPAVVLALCGGGYAAWKTIFGGPSPLTTCAKCGNPQQQCVCPTPVSDPKNVAVYIDNSASMAGYIVGKNDFIDALATLSKGVYPKAIKTVSLVDGKPVTDSETFISDLQKGIIKFASSSLLHKDLANIIKNLKDGDLALYVTDGIMSGESTDIAKKNDWSKVHHADLQERVSNAFKGTKYGASIYQQMSNYCGTYYCYDNQPVTDVKAARPFYVIAIGSPAVLKNFKDEVEAKKKDPSFYFKPCNAFHLIEKLPLAEGFSFEQSGAFRPDGDSYSYQPSAVQGGSIVCRIDQAKVFKYQSLPDSTAAGTAARFEVMLDGKQKVPVTYDKGTNLFKFSLDVSVLGPESKVSIALPYKVPEWIEASSCDDDKYMAGAMRDARTFLFNEFVWGIKNGLAPNVPNLYSKEITLKQKH